MACAACPCPQLKQNLAEIITRAKQRGITVILTGMEAPPNYGPLYTSEFRQVFRELAKEHDVIFVPFYLEGVAGDPEPEPLGRHPSQRRRLANHRRDRVAGARAGARETGLIPGD